MKDEVMNAICAWLRKHDFETDMYKMSPLEQEIKVILAGDLSEGAKLLAKDLAVAKPLEAYPRSLTSKNANELGAHVLRLLGEED